MIPRRAASVLLAAILVAGAVPVEAREIRLPGAPAFPGDLAKRLHDAIVARGSDYEPRTRHLGPDGSPKYVNRLIFEASPYLLQHAHNPVDWYPWGEEAFERARAEKKPVLLSVGYSTCHWCHVMERESFEDEEIAEFLNRHYVAVKVDREQRPDVDAIYMAAVQGITGSGGWPMTVWLTPDREPFFGGTYFPPRDGDRGARTGFLTLLRRVSDAYRSNPVDVAESAANITEHLRGALVPDAAAISGQDLEAPLRRAFESAAATFDEQHGGFGPAPKFPRPAMLEFLLRYHRRTGEPRALEMVERTLDAMARGGIRDHVGGGFHRYSTDARWLVPHFEKMLYDNAQLAIVYLEAYQATGEKGFAEVAREILGYVAREMTSSEGAFWSAGDAESEGGEGRYFLWRAAEIGNVLGEDRARRFGAVYGVTNEGNFEGRNVLHLAASPEPVAAGAGMSLAELRDELASSRTDLHRARQKRVAPLTDRKILVSWNGLMISAFARAAEVLGEGEHAGRAERAASFVFERLYDGRRLRRTWFDGRAEGTGYLDDYAFFAQALLDLFEATFDPKWLRRAIALHQVLEERFRDAEGGGYFRAPDDAERMLARDKPAWDGSEPSGNSVAALNLLRLAELTDDDRHRVRAEDALRGFGGVLRRAPEAVPKLLAAVEFRLGRPRQIVLVRPGDASAEPMLARLREVFLPGRVVVVAVEGSPPPAELRPLLEERTALRGELTAYVCEGRKCDLPTTDPAVFARQIRAAAAPLVEAKP